MREVHAEPSAWVLYEDPATGALYVQALCNHSAAYFMVDIPLLPDEARRAVAGSPSTLTEAGRVLIETLAREAQWSPAKFGERRAAAWRALGEPGEPKVPPLP